MDEIKHKINEGNYQEARILLDDYISVHSEYDDIIAILDATVALQEQDFGRAYECIIRGLAYNFENYELFFMLGNYYEGSNVDQAYLCYENAFYHCHNEDKEFLANYMEELKNREVITVTKTAIIILSYNTNTITQQCIESIRATNLNSTYELIIVDNASTDGSVEWLKKQDDIKLICNPMNVGFPAGCNQGIDCADMESDIFLLNSDTIVPKNAIFWLRMGLYEEKQVGATGCVSNNVTNYQKLNIDGITDKNYMDYAKQINIPMKFPYEEKTWLVGFAMLIKRSVVDQVGYLDELFTPGNYEDTDYGFRILEAGFQLRLCLNSFIFHYGATGFNKNRENYLNLLRRNKQKFKDKWNIDPEIFTALDFEMLNLLKGQDNLEFHILCVGCGCGAILSRIKRQYPYAKVEGIEIHEQAARIASYAFPVTCVSINDILDIYYSETFDFIIIGGLLQQTEHPEDLLKKLSLCLKPHGRILGRVYNSMHISVLTREAYSLKDELAEGIYASKIKKTFHLEQLVETATGSGYQLKDFYYQKNDSIISNLAREYQIKIAPEMGDRKGLLDAYQFFFILEKVVR